MPSDNRDRPRVFVFGAGYSAGAYLRRLPAGSATGVTTRTPDKRRALGEVGYPAFLFQGGQPLEGGIRDALAETTHLLVSVAPGAAGDPVLAALSPDLAELPNLRWIGYLSTVGVYGDHGGAWVDEATPPRPVSQRSRERVAAEAAWREAAGRRDAPLSILRLSGIYGPGRNAFENLRAGKARRLVKPGQVFNRIHVEDIAGALALLAQSRHDGVVNVTDDEPAPPQDVVAFAAEVGGYPLPPETDFDATDLTAMARSFYGENKRVSNRQLRALGYEFLYPTFREGLVALQGDAAG